MSRARCIKPAKRLRLHLDLPDLLRMMSKIRQVDRGHKLGPCWEWQGAKDAKGYGRIKIKGKPLWVHRVTYAVFVATIPELWQIDHQCLYPSCCNPRHLVKKTRSRNCAEANTRRAQDVDISGVPF